MAQIGFFDLSDRYASMDAKKDPLVEIDAVVPWEEFPPALERVLNKPDAERNSRAGRKPMGAVLMFKTLVLSALYNLSDDQIEYQVRKSHYGCKNHVNADRKHKLVRRYHVSDAALHDSQAVDHLLTRGNTGAVIWADAAYRSEGMEANAARLETDQPDSPQGQARQAADRTSQGSNRSKSTVRVRVEHIFGAQDNDMGGTLVRTIGMVRAKAKIGMKNLAYNMRRLGQLRRLNPCPA